MDLYIVRHAWSEERDSSRWPDDGLRPLTDAGKKRFAEVAQKLVRRGLAPQMIASSPLVRCVQTAEILAAAAGGSPEVVYLDELAPGSDLDGLLKWTVRQSRQVDRVAWVGHEPDVGQLIAALIGQQEAQIRVAKGGAAAIRFDERPAEGSGELQWLVTAKILGC